MTAPMLMQGAMVRCKAVKALKAVVQASMPVLALPEVQDGVSRALQVRAACAQPVYSTGKGQAIVLVASVLPGACAKVIAALRAGCVNDGCQHLSVIQR